MCKGLPTTPPALEDGPPRSTIDRSPIDMNFAKQAIAPRLQQMADATDHHIRAAAVEAGKSKSIHALTRHGFQTGWMGQLLRICTKLTPDQDYDGLGLLPIEEKLNDHFRDKTDQRTGKPVKIKSRTGGGVAAGMFYNPEIQHELMTRSLDMARTDARAFPLCEVRLGNGTLTWLPYNFIHVHLIRVGGSGVAFAKRTDWVKLSPEVVVTAINDFMAGTQDGKPPRPRFAQWRHLLDFLRVNQILRNGTRTEITMSEAQPVVMTMMPETVALGDEGFAPTSITLPDIEDPDKNTAKKLRSEQVALHRGCIWTGRLRASQNGVITSKKVPSWAEPM